MRKTIRKLLGFLLIASLLLSSVSALADAGDAARTGKVTLSLGTMKDKGFTDPDRVVFELFRIGVPTGVGSAWGPTADFKTVAFPDVTPDKDGRRVWSDEQAQAMITAAENVLKTNASLKPDYTATTANGGKAVFEGVQAGIYYIRKNADSRPKRLSVQGALVSVPG